VLPVKSSLSTANAEYDKLIDSKSPLPAPPVYAAKLSGLLKHLANAENAVAESVKARRELVAALEKILDTNRSALEADVAQQKQLAERRAAVDVKRQEVELEIIRGMGGTEGNDHHQSPHDHGHSATPVDQEPERPEMEALTPPSGDGDDLDFYNTEPAVPQNGHQFHVPAQQHHQQPAFSTAAPGIEMLSNLASQYQSVPIALNGSNKRRRVDSGDDFPDLGGDDGIDADVAEILRKGSA
jgi:regulator of Ty1 transposition protein 103